MSFLASALLTCLLVGAFIVLLWAACTNTRPERGEQPQRRGEPRPPYHKDPSDD